MHAERTLTVPRPPGAVFDYLADFTRTNEWDPGTLQTRRTSGDGGVGTTYANLSLVLGRRTEATYTTVAHDRPSRFQVRGTGGAATVMLGVTITPVAAGSGSRVHLRTDVALRGVRGLLAPFVLGRRLQRDADEVVTQLERVLINRT